MKFIFCKIFLLLTIFMPLSAQNLSSTPKHYSEWMTYSEMQRTPKSYLLDFSTRPKWSYVMGIELESMLDTYLFYKDKKILDYCQSYTDTMISRQGSIRGYRLEDYNLDNIRTGHFVARMYQLHPEPKNLIAMQTMLRQLENQPRTDEDRVFWHKAIYSYQVWLDGIFMGLPYYTLTASMLMTPQEAKKIYDDAVDQVSVTYRRTLDPKTGLNRHAWDETHEMFWADPNTGLSQHCWGRAQGWFTMALIELLDVLPADYPRRKEVIDILRQDLDAVIKWQDEKTGVWYQVMDSPGREGNYLESTCSCMFAYVLLKAHRKGYLGTTYRDAGIKAYRGIIKQFIREKEDHTISLTQCCSVSGLGPGLSEKVLKAAPNVKENRRRDGSYQYYLSEPIRDNDAKGIGPFIWASLEMERMGYDVSNTLSAINRQAVISRHNPIISAADPLAALSVGNGHLATTVDVTGMQSYPDDYRNDIPLTTMSDWGWHRFPNTSQLTPEESHRSYQFAHHDHPEVYAVEYKNGGRQQQATQYFRINPHRLNLATIGLRLTTPEGKVIPLSGISQIRQEQQLYDGLISSHFVADRQAVDVTTTCRQDCDAILYQIRSQLLSRHQASISIRFSYPTGVHSDDANDWSQPLRHTSRIIRQTPQSATILRRLDDSSYYLTLRWEGKATLSEAGPHQFSLTPSSDNLLLEADYALEDKKTDEAAVGFQDQLNRIREAWHQRWYSGGFVDFSDCTDPRAKELERRVILSQYLTFINCANNMPPQETGLTYNSWFGRPHLEMAWWHGIHFCLWNRHEVLQNMLKWYNETAYPEALNIAKRQGFEGIRWMKMTDPWAGEGPSNTGSFLIWQQPHYIYMAEEMYRAFPSASTLAAYGKQVEETARFMADFVALDTASHTYHLRGATAMQESMSKDFSYDHPFELAYWRYGLKLAQTWRERRGMPRLQQWDDIINHIASLPQEDGIYRAGLPITPFQTTAKSEAFDPFITPQQRGSSLISETDFMTKSRSDHPAVLGSCGLLPSSDFYSAETMKATLDWVMKNWNWDTTWGWDYGMVAMAAARLHQPSVAIDVLLSDFTKNRYLVSGHNFQTANRLRLYLPGNGALLTAIAMMCAGWDGGPQTTNPGFPDDGSWNVRWENLNKMQ